MFWYQQRDFLSLLREFSGGKLKQKGFFHSVKGNIFYFIFMHIFQHCFICRPSESPVSEDAGTNPGLLRLWHRLSDAITTWLDLIHNRLDFIQFPKCTVWYVLTFSAEISVAMRHFSSISKILTCKRGFFPSCMSDFIRPEPFHFRGLLHDIHTVINFVSSQC